MSDKFDSSFQSEIDQKNKKLQPGADDGDIFKVPASKDAEGGIDTAANAMEKNVVLQKENMRLQALVDEQATKIAQQDTTIAILKSKCIQWEQHSAKIQASVPSPLPMDDQNNILETDQSWKRLSDSAQTPEHSGKRAKTDEANGEGDFNLSDFSQPSSVSTETAHDAATNLQINNK